MKKLLQFLPLLALPIVLILMSYSSGSPGGRSGSPGDGGANCTGCHAGTALTATDWITSDIPAGGFELSEVYTITLTGTHEGVGKFGFEVTAEDDAGNKVGTLALLNATETKLTNGNAAVTHTASGNTPTGDTKTWTVEWTAPDDAVGDVTFYAAFNAANGTGNTSGDQIYLAQTTYSEIGSGGVTTDLFFSEYAEGSSNNKYLEIFNGTGANVDLSDYSVKVASNGAAWGSYVQVLEGLLANESVYVIANSSANAYILGYADITSTVTYYNGDDAVGLFKNDVLIDAVGVELNDPGTAWNVAGVSGGTKEHTLVRKSDICSPSTDWASSAGTNADDSQWIVYPQDTWTYLGAHTANCSGAPTVAVPLFSHSSGNYFAAFDLEITCSTELASIYYTTDGTDPDEGSTPYTGLIPINTTTTVKAIAYKDGYNTSAISIGNYNIIVVEDVATIADLRDGVIGEFYHLTGEVVQTYSQTFRGQRYIQDATAAILIDDYDGIITTVYNVGDGITGIVGELGEFGGMLQFLPSADPGPATSTGNVIIPAIITIAQMNTNFVDFEAQLVTIENVSFADGGANFANGLVYAISDDSEATGGFRTTFYNVDYIGTSIPLGTRNITGILNSHDDDGENITSRDLNDFEETGNVSTIAQLREGTIGNTYFLSGEVVQTYKQPWQNQRFIQDATAAILIDDDAGIITTDYDNGDGITGIHGTLTTANNMLMFQPSEDPGPASSTGNEITPELITIAQMNANFEDYESELVKMNFVTFADGGGTFNDEMQTSYEISDISDAVGYFRTTFLEADYLGGTIPSAPTNIIGICNSTTSGEYITSRTSADLEPTVPTIVVTSPNGYEQWNQGSTQDITWTNMEFTGNVNIKLLKYPIGVINLALNIANTGSWEWEIPNDFSLGSYKVKVEGINPGDPNDQSNDFFDIVPYQAITVIVINEIMYNSPSYDNEWMEIYNLGTETVDLEGFYILDDDDAHVPVVFPAGYSIDPGQYFTISLELADTLPFVPDFEGNASWSLKNSSDNLRFFHSSGQLIDNVEYDNVAPWPTAPDGNGPTLSLLSPELDNDLGVNWAASMQDDGTPGTVNFPTDPTITVTAPNGGEEIQQGTTFNVTWSSANYTGTVAIEIVDGESTLLGNADVADGTFAWAVTQDLGTNYKIRVSDQASGDPWDESDAVFSIVEPVELPNVVINEIMYNPPEIDDDSLEYIELYNNDVMSVNLEGWYFEKGVTYIFPNYELGAGEYLVVAIDTLAMLNTFGIVTLQWTGGALKNSGEDIDLRNADGDVIDYVDYDDANGWNEAADGYGPSLTLIDPMLDNSLPENWYVETYFVGDNADKIGIYGTPGALNNPDAAQGILISDGWRGVSAYAAPADPTLTTVIEKIADSVFMMQHFSDLYLPSYGINTIMNWDNEIGYQVNMINSRYLVVYGDIVTDKSVDLNTGWNILPVLSECAVDVETLLGGVAEVIFIKDLSSNLMYWTEGGITTLEYLVPGRAYFIKVSAGITVSFPDCVTKAIPAEAQKQSNPTSWKDVVPTSNSHAVGFAASALDMLQDGDVIGAFTANDVCAGMTIVGSNNASMLVWGDDIYTTKQDGYVENESLNFVVYRPSSGEQFEVEAIYDQSFGDAGQYAINGISFVTDLKAGATGFGDYNEVSISIYPNPAKETLNIVLSDFRASSIEIYSSLGQMVYTGEIAGEQSQININTLQKGFYFLKVYDNTTGKQETLSFIKE